MVINSTKVQPMKNNDGRSLEDLVALIESAYKPEGFKVDTRRKIYDAGSLVAELDIIISGRIGTSPIEILIECRDRPSDGPAPASWIEQLVGRRQRFQLHSIMAVSSTGFSSGAVTYAAKEGIELRHLREIGEADIAPLFIYPRWAPLRRIQRKHTGCRIFVSEKCVGSMSINPEALVFVDSQDSTRTSLTELKNRLPSLEIENSVQPGTSTNVTVNLYASLPERYSLDINGELVPVLDLQFDLTIQCLPPLAAASVHEYTSVHTESSADNTFAQIRKYVGDDSSLLKELTLILMPK
jgi:hypothetical protein